MTKRELVVAVSNRTGYRQTAVEIITDALFDEMSQALSNDKRVNLSGFGSFGTKSKPSRSVRDFSGNVITIPERKRAVFRMGKDLSNILNVK